jgi:hypothetical protein
MVTVSARNLETPMSGSPSEAQLEWTRTFTGLAIDALPAGGGQGSSGQGGDQPLADADDYESDSDATGSAKGGTPETDTSGAGGKDAVEATAKIKGMSDDDIKKMSVSDQAAELKKLQANGKPTGEARAQQLRILRNSKLDPEFKKKETERGDAIAKALKGDKELEKARDNWDKLAPADKVAALKKIVAAQSAQYGMTPPEIETYDKAPFELPNGQTGIENGNFDPDDGKLHLNTHAGAKLSSFNRSIDLVLHENGHNYQGKLIQDLKSGKLKEGDPEYKEAVMFSENDGGSGYVPPTENYETYVAQPKENHSRSMAAETTPKIVGAI